MGDENRTGWGNESYYSYVALREGAGLQIVARQMSDRLDKVGDLNGAEKMSARLIPIDDVYDVEDLQYDPSPSPKGNREQLCECSNLTRAAEN